MKIRLSIIGLARLLAVSTLRTPRDARRTDYDEMVLTVSFRQLILIDISKALGRYRDLPLNWLCP